MGRFIGRQRELQLLTELTQKKTASFIVVKGRRRIGKSRLISEFSSQFKAFYSFSGLAPDEHTNSKHQLDEFSRQIAREFNTGFARYEDWSDAFWAVGERIKSGKILLLFDEISWMGSKDPTFLGKIKNFWDLRLKLNDKLIFVICGSASSWIEKNILSSTGFVGRISYTLTLDELSLAESDELWPQNVSAYEKLTLLAVTGGVPKYLEEINFQKSAEENIKKLCFSKGGFLVDEFEKIFSDVFMRNSIFYKKILKALVSGAKQIKEINSLMGIDYQGRISEYLHELELAGFITRDFTWNVKSGHDSEQSTFRLSDNYMRFYLKYVEKNLSKINRDAFSFKSLIMLDEWYSILGLQFENLVLKNRRYVHVILGVNADEIVCDNPFFQKKTTKQQGCQIDYMIQTRFSTLYVCEIKFSKNNIGMSVIEDVQRKLDVLKKPKNFSCRPVLIHINGVTDELIDTGFFAKIIDFSEIFTTLVR